MLQYLETKIVSNQFKCFLSIFNSNVGFGLGMISLVTTVDLGETFGDQFGIVFSISTLISSVAMMLMPLLLDYWLRIYGLSWAVALLGALMWNNVPCGLMLFENYTSIWRCDDPNRRILPNQDLGLPGTSSQANDECPTPSQSPKGRNILLAHPSLTFAILTRLFNSVILFAWAIYLVPFGVSKGYSPSTAVFLSTSGGAGIFVGRTICIFVYHFQLMHSLPINVGGVVASLCMMVAFNIAESFSSLCTLSFVAGALVAYLGSWMQAYTIYVVCKKHFKTAVALSNSITGAGIVAAGIISGIRHKINLIFLLTCGFFLYEVFMYVLKVHMSVTRFYSVIP